MRDRRDTAVTICNMENLDPVGIHTGDSIVVCPSQTLTNREYHMLRDSALKLIRALEVEGGCNVQFALDPKSFQYYLIEVNPRVSRSSALASKASGYPIARVSAKIGIGMTLDEIMLANTLACFEPALDYVVTKMPRFAFDKYPRTDLVTDSQGKTPAAPFRNGTDNTLSTQMKATGEVMSIGRTFEESLLKAVRSLETGHLHLYDPKFDGPDDRGLLEYIREGRDDRIFAIAQIVRNCIARAESEDRAWQGAAQPTDPVPAEALDKTGREICRITGIDAFFVRKIRNIILMEKKLQTGPGDLDLLREAKRTGFSDHIIGKYWDMTEEQVFALRRDLGIVPVYKMIDTCASEFDSYVPYFYSTYEEENEAFPAGGAAEERVRFLRLRGGVTEEAAGDAGEDAGIRKIIVLGSGPIRIGQGVEFDYSTVHAVQTLQKAGYEAIIINNNPETVSTDYTCSDKLYFEPLCVEDVMNVIAMEEPEGVIATLGGQTAVNLAEPPARARVRIIGTDCDAIERAENRDTFEKLLEELEIPAQGAGRHLGRRGRPGGGRHRISCSRAAQLCPGRTRHADRGQGGGTAGISEDGCGDRRGQARSRGQIHPRQEVEIDAVCDGDQVFVPAIMELVGRTGVHSGTPSASIRPAVSPTRSNRPSWTMPGDWGWASAIRGLFNIQFIVDQEDRVFIIEVSPRSSRTVPFLSKAASYSLADMATLVSLGISLRDQGITARKTPDGQADPGQVIPGIPSSISERKRALLRKGPRVLLFQTSGYGRLPVPGDGNRREEYRL